MATSGRSGLAEDKWVLAAEAAKRTARWARIMTKVLISQSSNKSSRQQPQWEILNFVGRNKAESRGIVDLLAIRKSHAEPGGKLKRGDLLEMVIIQVKGGKAKWPTAEDRERLRVVQERYGAREVLLSEWREGSRACFYRLSDDEWQLLANPEEVFSPKTKKLTLAVSKAQ